MERNEMFLFYKNALQGVLTKPLCDEYKNEWRGCRNNKEKLVRLVMRQQSLPYFISHCYNGNGLTKGYIEKEFGEYINGKRPIIDADNVEGYAYGIYVGFNGICKPDNDVMAFMWCSSTTLEISTAKCPIVYVGCDTELHVSFNGYNTPLFYLFDNSRIVLDDADETCSIVAYTYSDNARVDIGKYCISKSIRVFRKELRL